MLTLYFGNGVNANTLDVVVCSFSGTGRDDTDVDSTGSGEGVCCRLLARGTNFALTLSNVGRDWVDDIDEPTDE